MKIRIQNVRLAFPDLFTARAFKAGQVPKYSATFILPPDHPQIAEINKAILEVATAKWGAKAEGVIKSIKLSEPKKFPLRPGELKEGLAGFEGNFYISASSAIRPTTLHRDKTPLTEADGVLYSGCYVNAVVDLYAMDKDGKSINTMLAGVQFLRDGDAFAGGQAASVDDFDDLGAGADADDLV